MNSFDENILLEINLSIIHTFSWPYTYMEIRRNKKSLGRDFAKLDVDYKSSHSIHDLRGYQEKNLHVFK